MYGIDNDIITNFLRYFGGFYKKFRKVDETIFNGITHPFETQLIDAKSIATEKELPGFGKSNTFGIRKPSLLLCL